MPERLNVTKVFLPPLEEYQAYIAQIWESAHITNQGPMLHELEKNIENYLGVTNFQLVTNGTLALQLALRALDITSGEVITTPFSYVATTSAILWERCTPIYVDIEPDTFCIDAEKIEAAITPATKAILVVHVFGYPCDIEKIEEIALKHNLKVIYDAAHAFGASYKGKSLLSFGDISITSLHATKLFHTVEGGGIVVKDEVVRDKIDMLKKFGQLGDEQLSLGINAKTSELHAAMGLANLKYIDEIIASRKAVCELYEELLGDVVLTLHPGKDLEYNYAYYPVIFDSEDLLLKVIDALNDQSIFPRRYFYPSLNRLPYIDNQDSCPVSEKISKTILCLPLYFGLDHESVKRVCKIIRVNVAA